MGTITDAGREMQLYVHTLASALACASGDEAAQFQVSGREPSPAAQKVRVQQELDVTLTHLDRLIRSKKAPPVGVPTATLGRRLVERGEKYDAIARTYTPGPGFETFLGATVLDTATAMELAAQEGN
ncbi:hypothetical protein OLG66_19795 [Mycobacterium senegalense]|uniref:hypothetical protein n=1 Tax=Mycolicibacterium senegalense TaxID=1796 RepID=UPI00222335B6|nr:hypothetical protein [Mycolicibacterium senegalense]MCW1823167.1 hypothetical protein [Mycolicibacterium senegalense]